MNWKEAFLKQAKDDFEVFYEFYKLEKPACRQLHYLQMATEKLAKAYRSSIYAAPPKTSHKAFSQFLQSIKALPDFQRKLGYQNKNSTYYAYIDSLLPIAQHIEDLAPEGKKLNKPNPEYPWRQGKLIKAPIEYNFPEVYEQQIQFNKLIELINKLLTIL